MREDSQKAGRSMRRRVLRMATVAVCALSLQAWSVRPASAAEIIVSAASSLTNAFRDLAPAFEARHADASVRLNFGASGTLMQQMVNGAPVDVFASADQATMDQGESRGLIESSTRANFVSNTLVVIVPVGSRRAPKRLTDLDAPTIGKIAIGLPAT
ncbi:MAG: molybdate ABC transporter substrate-binding protein, partial [Casimicrobiaceae bacterium]